MRDSAPGTGYACFTHKAERLKSHPMERDLGVWVDDKLSMRIHQAQRPLAEGDDCSALLCACVAWLRAVLGASVLEGHLQGVCPEEETKMVECLKGWTHEEQLKSLRLFLEKKRLKGDLIPVYNFLKGLQEG